MFPDFSTGRNVCFVFIGWTIPAGAVILSDRKCTAVFCTAERIFCGKLYSSSEKIRRLHRPCGRQPPAGPDPHHQLLPRGRPAGPSVCAQCLRGRRPGRAGELERQRGLPQPDGAGQRGGPDRLQVLSAAPLSRLRRERGRRLRPPYPCRRPRGLRRSGWREDQPRERCTAQVHGSVAGVHHERPRPVVHRRHAQRPLGEEDLPGAGRGCGHREALAAHLRRLPGDGRRPGQRVESPPRPSDQPEGQDERPRPRERPFREQQRHGSDRRHRRQGHLGERRQRQRKGCGLPAQHPHRRGLHRPPTRTR